MPYPKNVTEDQLQGVIEDFLSHLEASGMIIVDNEFPTQSFGDGFVLENYFATFS